MDKASKASLLQSKLKEFMEFKTTLNSNNIERFEQLKSEISELLDAKQKQQFDQLKFLEEKREEDDLPF